MEWPFLVGGVLLLFAEFVQCCNEVCVFGAQRLGENVVFTVAADGRVDCPFPLGDDAIECLDEQLFRQLYGNCLFGHLCPFGVLVTVVYRMVFDLCKGGFYAEA